MKKEKTVGQIREVHYEERNVTKGYNALIVQKAPNRN